MANQSRLSVTSEYGLSVAVVMLLWEKRDLYSSCGFAPGWNTDKIIRTGEENKNACEGSPSSGHFGTALNWLKLFPNY